MDVDVLKALPSSPQIFPEEEKLDHRRRRRNRMRASCLNCYASKRKCDKKRPCGRCVRLGTTGLCIYEVEDTCDGNVTELNEIKRLRQRIAELESLIRELKKNPHPRWTAPGGVMHDPEFFESFRKSIPQVVSDTTRLSSADVMEDSMSTVAIVKAEETALCPPELVASGHGSHLSTSHGQTSELFQPTVSLSGNSEMPVNVPSIHSTTTMSSSYHDSQEELFPIVGNLDPNSKSTPGMHRVATSMNTHTACNPFTTDSSCHSCRSASETCRSHSSKCAPTPNCEYQTTASARLFQTNYPQSSHNSPDPCNCLTDPVAFGPLLHLGISLRTSREALDRLHSLSSDCVLYCYIIMLEKYIFSVPPHEPNTKLKPSQGPYINNCPSRSYSNRSSHSPSREVREYLSPHPIPHSYPSTLQCHQLAPRSPDPFAYMSDATVCMPHPS